ASAWMVATGSPAQRTLRPARLGCTNVLMTHVVGSRWRDPMSALAPLGKQGNTVSK
ncbi:Uncharacterized protein FKW44_008529, partial [Caligus rogercresseyi]